MTTFRQFLESQTPENLTSLVTLRSLLPQLAGAAQKVYDNWEQSEDGLDDEYGGGGICHDIADAMVEVLSHHNIDAFSYSQSIGDVHVYVIAQLKEGVYEINIPPEVYERGSGYSWTKIPGVHFQPGHIIVAQISPDPHSFNDYADA